MHHVVENDVAISLVVIAGQQARKDRIAVETRIAPPNDPAGRVDQRRRVAVAENGEVEAEILHERYLASVAMRVHERYLAPLATRASQERT